MKTSFVTFSTASMNILAHADTIEAARKYAGDTDDYAVIFECPAVEAERLSSYVLPRRNMKIVWRGGNDLAQAFRNKSWKW